MEKIIMVEVKRKGNIEPIFCYQKDFRKDKSGCLVLKNSFIRSSIAENCEGKYFEAQYRKQFGILSVINAGDWVGYHQTRTEPVPGDLKPPYWWSVDYQCAKDHLTSLMKEHLDKLLKEKEQEAEYVKKREEELASLNKTIDIHEKRLSRITSSLKKTWLGFWR